MRKKQKGTGGGKQRGERQPVNLQIYRKADCKLLTGHSGLLCFLLSPPASAAWKVLDDKGGKRGERSIQRDETVAVWLHRKSGDAGAT